MDRQQRAAIATAVRALQQEGKIIESARIVCERVRDSENLEVSQKLAAQVMKKDLRLSYIKTKRLHPKANSDRCLVLRQ